MTLRVALTPGGPPRTPATSAPRPAPLLDPCGARVIVGGAGRSEALAAPIVPAADSLFAPRGAALVADDGPLIVCDTGHHRLLIWKKTPRSDAQPADLLIGQPHLAAEGRNGKCAPGPATLNVPTGIAAADGILAVADAWNHRVLLWHGIPHRTNQPADVVLGQTDFTASLANRGADAPGAETLNWCYGVALHAGRLYVADTGNRRVLVWNDVPERNGAAADLVLGQRDFITRDEAGGGHAPGAGMRWPHAIALADERLFVTDAGLSRVMAWNARPTKDGQPCDMVLGQRDLHAGDHNVGGYHPTAASMSMPYGLCAAADELVVADTANSRLLGFDLGALATGRAASRLTGQKSFTEKGDNRWAQAARDSLCWPYGVSRCGTTLVVADSGNNRVLLWDAA